MMNIEKSNILIDDISLNDSLQDVMRRVKEEFDKNRKEARAEFWRQTDSLSPDIVAQILTGVRAYAMQVLNYRDGGFTAPVSEKMKEAMEYGTDMFILETICRDEIRDNR